MKCFQCAKGRMATQITEITSHVRGEEVPVCVEATVCTRCGFQVLSDEQSNAYTIASADAYRRKHNLLTTAELKEVRVRLGMSFRAFAAYLKVSEASPKRWEAGLVQDEAMDELIRLKTDPANARRNVAELETRLGLSSTRLYEYVAVLQLSRLRESDWQARGGTISKDKQRFAEGRSSFHYSA